MRCEPYTQKAQSGVSDAPLYATSLETLRLWLSYGVVSIAVAFLLSVFYCYPAEVSAAEPAKSKAVQAVRILHFPDKYSCGALYSETYDSSEQRQDATRIYLAPARGDVRVPANATISLYISFRSALHLQDLDRLGPNDLFKICFDRIDTEDPLELAPLGHLTGLTELRFVNSNLNDAGVAKLAPLKKLMRLHLWWCSLKGTTFNTLIGMHDLSTLNVSLNPLGPAAFEALSHMPQITDLDLSKSGVTDADLEKISKISGLIRLNIDSNSDITAKGLQYLRSCKKLEHVKLAKGRLTANDVQSLKGTNLKVIAVSGEKWTKKDWAKLKVTFPHTLLVDEDPVDSDTKFMLAPIH